MGCENTIVQEAPEGEGRCLVSATHGRAGYEQWCDKKLLKVVEQHSDRLQGGVCFSYTCRQSLHRRLAAGSTAVIVVMMRERAICDVIEASSFARCLITELMIFATKFKIS